MGKERLRKGDNGSWTNSGPIKNSADFIQRIRDITLDPDCKLVSYDAEALFPSVPIKDWLAALKAEMEKDTDFNKTTKLTVDDVIDLLDLCLSSTNFTFNGHHHTQQDSGPIGLSVMVTISKFWMFHTMDRAMEIADQKGIQKPKHMGIYMDENIKRFL